MRQDILHKTTGKVLLRAGEPMRRADLSGAEMSRADLSWADLSRADLSRADLSRADLHGANLYGADLSWADLHGANLREADLSGADLHGANLRGADLHGANLRRADLSWADLSRADLSRADLSRADLHGANLYGANLSWADLHGANLPDFALCPEEGAFIAWKKTADAVLKIEIPADASRTSCLINRKCRAEYVRVLAGWRAVAMKAGETTLGRHDRETVYTIGGETRPDKYDDDIRVDCTHGIHFFMTRKEAEKW